jgi:hypothetical protein
MGNRILLWGIFFAVFGTNAQILRNYDFDTSVSSRQLMLVNGVLEYGGSAMENGIFNALIFGGFIDSWLGRHGQCTLLLESKVQKRTL